jgi:asparagine synthase (glutamine-hydrolysing)
VQTVIEEMEDALAPYVNMDVVRSTVDQFAQNPLEARPVDVVSILQVIRMGFLKIPEGKPKDCLGSWSML